MGTNYYMLDTAMKIDHTTFQICVIVKSHQLNTLTYCSPRLPVS